MCVLNQTMHSSFWERSGENNRRNGKGKLIMHLFYRLSLPIVDNVFSHTPRASVSEAETARRNMPSFIPILLCIFGGGFLLRARFHPLRFERVAPHACIRYMYQ
jgi:hypothetical protein